MGLLDIKARMKAPNSFSVARGAQYPREPFHGSAELPVASGGTSAFMTRESAVVRYEATTRTKSAGFRIGIELHHMIAHWPEGVRNLWEERAAILEYDADVPRPLAEWQAYEIVCNSHGSELFGPRVR
jgi:hypothetical protein